jgi:hypothetical protein
VVRQPLLPRVSPGTTGINDGAVKIPGHRLLLWGVCKEERDILQERIRWGRGDSGKAVGSWRPGQPHGSWIRGVCGKRQESWQGPVAWVREWAKC